MNKIENGAIVKWNNQTVIITKVMNFFLEIKLSNQETKVVRTEEITF